MMTSKDPEPRQKMWELATALADRCAPVAFNYTVPIFLEAEVEGKLKAVNFGSGVWVRLEVKPILLTAGHVLDEVVKPKGVIGLSTGKSGTPGVKLLYEKAASNITPGDERPGGDYVDVGAFLLIDEVAQALADRFASEGLLEPRDNELEGNQYLVRGFPASRKKQYLFKTTAQAKAFSYATSLYRLGRGTPSGYDAEVEVLVDYSKKNNRSRTFQKVMASDPFGMSGCGIWRMVTSDPPSESWDVSCMRLVGLTHTYCRKLAIVRGTRIGIFVEMVKQTLL